ncbi:MAG: HD domain-containing protein [Azospirillaceae bacterium]
MTKKTRDNLYEYIFLTDLEAAVARHPLFLRLHYVHQNSFTFLTYPTAHMQRHPHCLGVMHVAGLMFSHSFQNTVNQAVIEKLVSGIYFSISNLSCPTMEEVSEEAQRTNFDLFHSESVYSQLLGVEQFATGNNFSEKYLPVCVMFQATRLAALLHDVGHPPFSHIVEYGFQSAIGDEYDHEKVGKDLSKIIFDDVINPQSMLEDGAMLRRHRKFANCCCKLAQALLESDSGADKDIKPLIGIKRSILAGDVDADRLDYVRRDIESTALTATSYDLGRILDSLHLRDSEQPGAVEAGLSPGALSAVETFFVARFHLYRWAIFHHDVARRNLCMHRFVHSFLLCRNLPDNLAGLRDDFRSLATESSRRREYKYFIDGYFLKILWEVHDTLSSATGSHTQELRDLHLYCDLVLNRNNARLKSLWKRPDHYALFAKSYYGSSETSGRECVKALNAEFRDIFERDYKPVHGEKLGRFKFAQDFEAIATKLIGQRDHRLFVAYTAPFRAGPSRLYFTESAAGEMRRIEVDDVSPTIASLRDAWEHSPQISVFYEVTEAVKNMGKSLLSPIYNDAIRGALEQMRTGGTRA